MRPCCGWRSSLGLIRHGSRSAVSAGGGLAAAPAFRPAIAVRSSRPFNRRPNPTLTTARSQATVAVAWCGRRATPPSLAVGPGDAELAVAAARRTDLAGLPPAWIGAARWTCCMTRPWSTAGA